MLDVICSITSCELASNIEVSRGNAIEEDPVHCTYACETMQLVKHRYGVDLAVFCHLARKQASLFRIGDKHESSSILHNVQQAEQSTLWSRLTGSNMFQAKSVSSLGLAEYNASASNRIVSCGTACPRQCQ